MFTKLVIADFKGDTSLKLIKSHKSHLWSHLHTKMKPNLELDVPPSKTVQLQKTWGITLDVPPSQTAQLTPNICTDVDGRFQY